MRGCISEFLVGVHHPVNYPNHESMLDPNKLFFILTLSPSLYSRHTRHLHINSTPVLKNIVKNFVRSFFSLILL